MRSRPMALVAVLAVLALAACDDDGDGDGDGSDVSRGIDTLGNDFVEAFEQGPNDEPVDAQAVSLTLTPTIEPFDP